MRNEPFEPGEIVLSKAGRDRGRAFVVTEILDGDYVLLADGKLRTLERPKKKKRKHLLTAPTEAKMEFSAHPCNADVRKFLIAQGYENDRKE